MENKLVGIEQLESAIESAGKVRNSLLSAITKRICGLTDYGKQTIEFNVPISTTEELGEIMNIGAVDYGLSLISVNEYGEDVCVNEYLPIDSLIEIAERLIKGEYIILEED